MVDQEHGVRFLKASRVCQLESLLVGIAAGIQSAGGRGYVPGTVKAMKHEHFNDIGRLVRATPKRVEK